MQSAVCFAHTCNNDSSEAVYKTHLLIGAQDRKQAVHLSFRHRVGAGCGRVTFVVCECGDMLDIVIAGLLKNDRRVD